jgi:hypothetical protein
MLWSYNKSRLIILICRTKNLSGFDGDDATELDLAVRQVLIDREDKEARKEAALKLQADLNHVEAVVIQNRVGAPAAPPQVLVTPDAIAATPTARPNKPRGATPLGLSAVDAELISLLRLGQQFDTSDQPVEQAAKKLKRSPEQLQILNFFNNRGLAYFETRQEWEADILQSEVLPALKRIGIKIVIQVFCKAVEGKGVEEFSNQLEKWKFDSLNAWKLWSVLEDVWNEVNGN